MSDLPDCAIVVSTDQAHDVVTLSVAGELDLASAPALRAAIQDHEATSVIIDFAAVTFIDCSAIGVFVAARNRAQEAGHHFAIRNVTARQRRVLEIAGVYDFLTHQE